MDQVRTVGKQYPVYNESGSTLLLYSYYAHLCDSPEYDYQAEL